MTMPLRARLTIWYAALLAAVLALFCAVILWLDWRSVLREEDEGLRTIGLAAVRAMANEFAENNRAASAAAEAEETLQRGGVIVRVVDATGHPVSGRAQGWSTTENSALADASTIVMDGRSWRVAVVPGVIGGTNYYAQVAGPLDETIRQHGILLRVSLLGLPLMIALAAGGGWWLAHRALRPLSRMASEAESIDAAAAERRLTTPDAAPELKQVALTFNSVLDRLATALADQRR